MLLPSLLFGYFKDRYRSLTIPIILHVFYNAGYFWYEMPVETHALMVEVLSEVARDAEAVFQAMLRQGVIVRSMKGYGYPDYIRVNVGTPEENQRFIEALKAVLDR